MRPQRIEPGPGQESVWDYPRPPRLEDCARHLVVRFNGAVIADTRRGKRVLETSHPPVYYFPPADVRAEYLVRVPGASFCEYKGTAGYYTVSVGDRTAPTVAWFYTDPSQAFEGIRDFVAFYAGPMDECLVDGVRAAPQPGGFYGGWVTPDVVGPFKGTPGTAAW
jgi:uncharacterized protein (DUF427 family)